MKVRIGSTELEYEQMGSGDPLVLVHGSLQSMHSFERFMAPFSEDYRVIAYTRRHHLGSEDPEMGRPLTVSAAADDLIDLIETLDLAPAHVVAHSYGAAVALIAATRRVELFRSLILSEPVFGSLLQTDPNWSQAWTDFRQAAMSARLKVREGDEEGGVQAFVDSIFGEGSFQALPPPFKEGLLANAKAFALEEPPELPFTETDARKAALPILLMSGERSAPWLRRMTANLKALLPNAEEVEIAGTNHATFANTEAFIETIQGFLRRQ